MTCVLWLLYPLFCDRFMPFRVLKKEAAKWSEDDGIFERDGARDNRE